jgi:homoserine dehydrogenase
MIADLVLIGFGNVARRFVRLLDERRRVLDRRYDLTCRVIGLATRRHGTVLDSRGVDAIDAARRIEHDGTLSDLPGSLNETALPGADQCIAVLAQSHADIRVVIETTTLDIVSGQPALDHVRLGLAHGCHVVTANKGPAAFAYRELSEMAAERHLSFLFEGAVMDGIPVFNLVRDTMPAVEILGFRGVINSTTNHILTALENGHGFAAALAEMQAAGIAEADASLDLDGWDAAAKAAVLANVFMDAGITPREVARSGVAPDCADRAMRAVARGRRLRLIASAARGSLPSVELVDVPAGDLLAGLSGTANALILDTDTLGKVAIAQLDGGLLHTAYALLSDLISIASAAPRPRN